MPSSTVIEAIEKAIQAEIEGHHFYRMAARTTDDAQGREVFETLAAEERQHADYLRASTAPWSTRAGQTPRRASETRSRSPDRARSSPHGSRPGLPRPTSR